MSEEWTIHALLGALKAGRWLAVWSLAFSTAALLGEVATAFRIAILVAGLGVLWFSVRLAIDEHLFRNLQPDSQSLERLDDALIKLGWIKEGKGGRRLSVRIAGTLRLARWQAGLTASQGLLWLAALWLA